MTRKIRAVYSGRMLIVLASLALIALAIYEISIRIDDSRAWMAGIRRISERHGTPFVQDLFIAFEAPEMQTLLYRLLAQAACVPYGAFCLLKSNRPRATLPIIILGAALWIAGIWTGWAAPVDTTGGFAAYAASLNSLPLPVILVAAGVNLFQYISDNRPRRRRLPAAERAALEAEEELPEAERFDPPARQPAQRRADPVDASVREESIYEDETDEDDESTRRRKLPERAPWRRNM